MTGNDPISDILMNVQGNCPNCNTTLTFMPAAQLAKNNGVKEDAVMCHNCHKVYTVNLTLHDMSFVEELKTDFNTGNSNNEENIKDYADEFKNAFESGNLNDAISINKEWASEYPNDANVFYAGTIVQSLDNNVGIDALENMNNAGNKLTAVSTGLEQWYKNKAITAINTRKTEQISAMQNSQPSQNMGYNSNNTPPQFNQQSYNQQSQYNINNVEADPEDKSIFTFLFYKRDKKTQKYRISKTKTISLLWFILLFIFISVISITDPTIGSSGVLITLIAILILTIIMTLPVFIIGLVISYILDKRVQSNTIPTYQPNMNQQYNPQYNKQYNTQQVYNEQVNQQTTQQQAPVNNSVDFNPAPESNVKSDYQESPVNNSIQNNDISKNVESAEKRDDTEKVESAEFTDFRRVKAPSSLSDSDIDNYLRKISNTGGPFVIGEEYEYQSEVDKLVKESNRVVPKVSYYLESFAKYNGSNVGCDAWYYGGKYLIIILSEINTAESIKAIADTFSISSNSAEWYWNILRQSAVEIGKTGDKQWLPVLNKALEHPMSPTQEISDAIEKISGK